MNSDFNFERNVSALATEARPSGSAGAPRTLPDARGSVAARPLNRIRFAPCAGRFLLVCILATAILQAAPSSWMLPGDFNNDGEEDLLFPRDGRYFILPNAAQADSSVQVIDFRTAPPFLIPDTAKVADINQDGFPDVILASGPGNRLLIIYGQSSLSAPFRADEFPLPGGPVGADAAQFIEGGALEILTVLTALPPPLVGQSGPVPVLYPHLAMLSAAGERIASYALPDNAGRLRSLGVASGRLLRGEALPQFAWLFEAEEEHLALWWTEFEAGARGSPPAAGRVSKVDAFTFKQGIVKSSLPLLASGFLLGSREDGQWIVFPGNSDVIAIVPANVPRAREPEAHIEQLGFLADAVVVLEKSEGDLLLAVAADGTFAKLLRWRGPGELAEVETIPAPPGHLLTALLPLSDGNLFATLRPPGSSARDWTHLAHYDRAGEVKRWSFVNGWPSAPKPLPMARVMVFDRDPFSGSGAVEWESFSVGAWAMNAEIQGGEVLVEFQEDAGVPNGLGESETTRLVPHRALPAGAVALANQWEPDSSLFFAGVPGASGGAGLRPNPPPGSYIAPINLTFSAGRDVTVFFRTGAGDWQTGRGPAPIEQTAAVQFYGIGPDGSPGSIRTVVYSIGQPSASLTGTLREDLDGNGLDDAWERLLFGETGVDPNADHDGDGFTTGQEYEAGTDPLDPESSPAGDPGVLPPIIARIDPGGAFSLRMEQAPEGEVFVEISGNLTDWESASSLPRRNPDGSLEWTDPEPLGEARFYRLRFVFP